MISMHVPRLPSNESGTSDESKLCLHDVPALRDAPHFETVEAAHAHFRVVHESNAGDPLATAIYAQFAADVLNDSSLASKLFATAATQLNDTHARTPSSSDSNAEPAFHEVSVLKTVLGLTGAFQISTGKKEQVDDAQQKLNRALALDPLDPVVLGTLGKLAHHGRKDYKWAEELLQVSTEANPDHATLWIAYGNLHKEIGAKELRQAGTGTGTGATTPLAPLESKVKSPNARTASAAEGPGLARLAAAKKCFEKALRADPTSCDAMGDLAALLHGYFGDHVRAKQLYQQALIADPFHVRTMSNFALFLADHERDPESSRLLYERALTLEPNHANTLYNYAVLLDGAFGDSDGATDAYRRAIQCDPSHSFAWFNLAVCLNNAYQGEWDDDSDRASVALEAEGAFRRALKLRPNDAQSMLGLADMLLKNKQGSTSTQRQTQREAEMLLILALGVDPTNVSVNVKLGKLLRSRRRFDEARSHLSRAFELDPANVDALCSLGDLEHEDNNRGEAEQWYRNALLVDDANIGARCGLARVLLESVGEMFKHSSYDLPQEATSYGVVTATNKELGLAATLYGKALLYLTRVYTNESESETREKLVAQARDALEQSNRLAPNNPECLEALDDMRRGEHLLG